MKAQHRFRTAFCAATCGLLVLGCVRPARSELPVIDVAAVGCRETAELMRILALELRAQIVVGAQHAARVDVACRGSTATIVVDDRITAKSSRRDVGLQPNLRPVVQARLLAVAAAELVRWSWSEVTANGREDSSPAAGPPPPAAAVRAVKTAIASAPALAISAFAHVRNFYDGLTFFGGGLGLVHPFASHWQLAVEAVAAGGGAHVEPGSVRSTLWGAAAHASRIMWSGKRARACMGAGARADVLTLEPQAKSSAAASASLPEDLRTWLAGPFGRASFRVSGAAATWGATATIEVGYAFGGVRGTVPYDRDVNVRQLWQAALVGLEVAL